MMQENPEINSIKTSNSNISTEQDKRAPFFKQYPINLDEIIEITAKFIFENRGFFISYANGSFESLLIKQKESPYFPFLQKIKETMTKLIEKISPWVKAEINSLEKVSQYLLRLPPLA